MFHNRFHSKKLKKQVLVFDLDETIFVRDDIYARTQIHIDHALSEPFSIPLDRRTSKYTQRLSLDDVNVLIINPDDLKALIECAYKNDAEIMILTSGLYDEETLVRIANVLKLTDDVRIKFVNSYFSNPINEIENNIIEPMELDILQTTAKAGRIHAIANHLDMKNHHFILLDDNSTHTHSCLPFKYMSSIRAATFSSEKKFYKQVENMLIDSNLAKQTLGEAINRHELRATLLFEKYRHMSFGNHTLFSGLTSLREMKSGVLQKLF